MILRLLRSFLQRLDNLEQKTNEITALKQQLDVLKPAVISVKNTTNGALKDVSVLKTAIEQMKSELNATKVVIDDLQLYLSSGNGQEGEEEVVTVQLEVSQEIDNATNATAVANLKDLIEQELNDNL